MGHHRQDALVQVRCPDWKSRDDRVHRCLSKISGQIMPDDLLQQRDRPGLTLTPCT